MFPGRGVNRWAIWMLNGGQIGVKSRPEGPSHVSRSSAAPIRRARVTLLYRPVAQVPLVRSRPDREYKLLHDVLQPEFVRQIIKVEFHGPTHLTPLSLRPSPFM